MQDTRHTNPNLRYSKSALMKLQGASADDVGCVGGREAMLVEGGENTEGTIYEDQREVMEEIASLRREIVALRGEVAHSQQLEELPVYSI